MSLTRFAANIAPGTLWRQDMRNPYPFMPCAITIDIGRWTEADNRIENFDEFDRVFRDELRSAGFRGGADHSNLFEDQGGSDLQVGALLTGLRMKTCTYLSLVTGTLSGSAVMDVEWQVYSVSQAKIVGRVVTHGGFDTKRDGRPNADIDPTDILRGAFADNVHRLTGSREFRDIVLAPASPASASDPTGPPLTIKTVSDATPIASTVKSVVSIFAGEAMGSGVLISPEGFILTNQHVAGSSGPVRIHWADGSDTVGEVVKSDRRRDVALIKTTPRAQPLSLRRTPAQLGETVFAIGTPLRSEFANTLTRGVVSGTRLLEGLPLIQSDVAIDHGNSGGPLLDDQGRVIALTVARYEEDGVGHSINFFIPIDDAVQALGLSLQDTPQALPPRSKPRPAPRKPA